METINYNGRLLDYKMTTESILIVWLQGDILSSFEVKRRERGDVFAYAFNGDFTIEEVNKGKQIFEVYEDL
jgi:hypothetical protein